MKVLVLDNYDSFTFNLVQYLGELGAEMDVVRNDRITIDEVEARRPDAVVISPGPGGPTDAGVSIPLVRWAAETATPLLGVCLGHQAIAEAFGAVVVKGPAIMHGKTSVVHHDGRGVLRDLPDPFDAMRYHSLVIDRSTLPPELTVSAWTDDDVVMGVRHATLPMEGVQFHPESILTTVGRVLLANFLTSCPRQ
jgi:anthranilate synthase/aminodeoxychorismate synthase-like glutamine amidotransferase